MAKRPWSNRDNDQLLSFLRAAAHNSSPFDVYIDYPDLYTAYRRVSLPTFQTSRVELRILRNAHLRGFQYFIYEVA